MTLNSQSSVKYKKKPLVIKCVFLCGFSAQFFIFSRGWGWCGVYLVRDFFFWLFVCALVYCLRHYNFFSHVIYYFVGFFFVHMQNNIETKLQRLFDLSFKGIFVKNYFTDSIILGYISIHIPKTYSTHDYNYLFINRYVEVKEVRIVFVRVEFMNT